MQSQRNSTFFEYNSIRAETMTFCSLPCTGTTTSSCRQILAERINKYTANYVPGTMLEPLHTIILIPIPPPELYSRKQTMTPRTRKARELLLVVSYKAREKHSAMEQARGAAVKPPPGTQAHHIREPGLNPGSAPSSNFLYRTSWEAAADGPSSWAPVPHMGDPD